MSAVGNIPEIINNFNVYNNGGVLVGITGQVPLPNFEAITEEIGGAGILGTYNTAIPGFYSGMEQALPFRIIYSDMFALMNPSEPIELTMRGSAQMTDKATGALVYKPIRVVERGRFKDFNPGTLELGKQMGAEVKWEVLYILIEVDGKTEVEYDKLNNVFVVHEKDLLEKVRAYS